MVYLIAQVIGIIAFIISNISYHRKNKKDILTSVVISNVLNLLHYLLLQAYSGCVTKILAIFRDSFIILKDKNKKLTKIWFLLMFIVLYLIALIITYNGVLSIFPLIAAIIYMIVEWNGNSIAIKKIAFICYFLWLIYNIFVFSIVGIVSNVISIISTLIALINEKNSVNKI